jgi:molybdate/tungstate transport system ATP-binding protein
MTDLRPAALEWRDVTLYTGAFVLSEVSLRLEPEAWLALTGPTGAGKTLLLEMAAGFLTPSAGRILRDGADVTERPPEWRRIAYVPQDDLLFPFLDVRRNLIFADGRLHGKLPAAQVRFAEVVNELGLGHLLERRVQTLSGGEAQRVAIGRALLAGGDVLLLDECTSALDEETRETIGGFLRREQRRHGLAVVQVTHDLAEAERLADAVIGIAGGKLLTGVAAREGFASGAQVVSLAGHGRTDLTR